MTPAPWYPDIAKREQDTYIQLKAKQYNMIKAAD